MQALGSEYLRSCLNQEIWSFFLKFWNLFCPGMTRDRGFCSGTFAPAFVPGQRDTETKKNCPGTKGQWDIPSRGNARLGQSQIGIDEKWINKSQNSNEQLFCIPMYIDPPRKAYIMYNMLYVTFFLSHYPLLEYIMFNVVYNYPFFSNFCVTWHK